MYAPNYNVTNMKCYSSYRSEKPNQRKKTRKRTHDELLIKDKDNLKSYLKTPAKKHVKYEQHPKALNQLQQLQQQSLFNYAFQQTTAQRLLELQQQNFYDPTFLQLLVQLSQVQSNNVQLHQQILNYQQLIEMNSNKFIASQYGYKFEDKYILGQKLGEGGQGSVYSG